MRPLSRPPVPPPKDRIRTHRDRAPYASSMRRLGPRLPSIGLSHWTASLDGFIARTSREAQKARRREVEVPPTLYTGALVRFQPRSAHEESARDSPANQVRFSTI